MEIYDFRQSQKMGVASAQADDAASDCGKRKPLGIGGGKPPVQSLCMHCCASCAPHLASICMHETAITCGVTLDHDRAVALQAYTFRALQKTYGPMWVRCDLCRRYAHLRLTGLLDADYRTSQFSCSRCGSDAWVCLVEPV